MSSIFQGRRKQQRAVPAVNEYDPWGNVSSDEAEASTASRTAAGRIMNTMRRFSYSTPKKRERGYSQEGGMYSTPAENNPPTPSGYSFQDDSDTRPTIEQIAMGLHISRTPHVLPPRSSQTSHSPSNSHLVLRRSVDMSPRFPSHSAAASRHTSLPPSAFSKPVVPILLPPPPPRSSFKKVVRPSTAESATLVPSASDASLSTLTSNGPSTPRSARQGPLRSASVPVPSSSFSGKLRMEITRLFPGGRKGSVASPGSRSESPQAMTPSSSSDVDSLSSAGHVPKQKSVRFSAGIGAIGEDV